MEIIPESNNDITEVTFLKDKTEGNVFAYFKNFVNYPNGNRESCDFNGHSACSESYAKECDFASNDEYLSLYKHLSKMGYNLKVEDNPERPSLAYVPSPNIEDHILSSLEQTGEINEVEFLFGLKRSPEELAEIFTDLSNADESITLGSEKEISCSQNEFGEPEITLDNGKYTIYDFTRKMEEELPDGLSSELSPILAETGIAIANASGYKYDEENECFYKQLDSRYPDESPVYTDLTNISQVAGLIDIKPLTLLESLQVGGSFVERNSIELETAPSVDNKKETEDAPKEKKSSRNLFTM